MALELFDLAGADARVRFSPYCWRVKMALAHKGLDAQTVPVRFTEKETIAFSGQKLVPVLRRGKEVVSDSWEIALWLDRVHPDRKPLFEGPQALALADFVRVWSQSALTIPVFKTIILDLFATLAEKDRAYFRQSREQRFGMSLEDFRISPEDGRAEIRKALTPARDLLSRRPFLSGDEPAFADYCMFGVFMWARAVSAIPLLDEADSVHAWRERMLDLYGGLARAAPAAQA